MTSPRIITGPETDTIRDRTTDLIRAMLDGGVLHYTDSKRHFNATSIASKHGRKLRSKSDGFGGRYWWIEAPE